MLAYTARSPLPVSAATLFDWHERPGAFIRLTPPWQRVTLESFEGIRDGERAVIRLGAGPASIRWVAEHQDYRDGCRGDGGFCQFEDVQVAGPFASWHHSHRMIAAGPEASVLEDRIRYELPLAPLSHAVGAWAADGQLDRMFGYRHRVTKADLAQHATWEGEPWTIAVTGSSGLLGEALCAFLTGGGHRVVRLVRSREAARRLDRGPQERTVYWNPSRGEIDTEGLAAHAPQAVIHLAGEPVYGFPWHNAKKRAIWESRTQGTLLLSRALAALPTPPEVFLSASASGIYGDTGDRLVTEGSPTGSGFLADVCRAWEASTADAEAAGIAATHLRIGLVLSPAGGLLGNLAPIAQTGLAAWPGDGSAFWPWIALDDLLYAVHHLLQARLAGPVNLSAPAPAPSRQVVRALGRTLGRPTLGRLPAPLLRTLGGEAAQELALKSVRMMPERLRESGFAHRYPTLDGALAHLMGRV